MDGELFGERQSQNIEINLENGEVVSAFEFYNFPSTNDDWHETLCAFSIFTTSKTETQKQILFYGPNIDKASNCKEAATERIYGDIPSHLTFKEFLRSFTSTRANDNYITINLPLWKNYTTAQNITTEPLGKFYNEIKIHLC